MATKLFILTAPSGGGKTTVAAKLLAAESRLRRVITCTTRAPRPGEQDGRDYHFLTSEAFADMEKTGELLESANVHGHAYGTPKKSVTSILANGQAALLIVDWQGARQVRGKIPEAITVFLKPPSLEELDRRLRERKTESAQTLQRRLNDAKVDLGHAQEFDHVIINDKLEAVVSQVLQIIRQQLP